MTFRSGQVLLVSSYWYLVTCKPILPVPVEWMQPSALRGNASRRGILRTNNQMHTVKAGVNQKFRPLAGRLKALHGRSIRTWILAYSPTFAWHMIVVTASCPSLARENILVSRTLHDVDLATTSLLANWKDNGFHNKLHQGSSSWGNLIWRWTYSNWSSPCPTRS